MPEKLNESSESKDSAAIQREIEASMEKANEEFRLFMEAQESNDPEMKVSLFMRYAQKHMRENWGIEDLTVPEGDELRKIIRNLLPKYEKEKKLVSEGKMRSDNFAEIEEEAPAVWLLDLYGIHVKDIPKIHIIMDASDGQEYKYEQIERDVFEAKENELRNLGHRVGSKDIVDPAWKKYLEKIRKEHPYGDLL
jgi:hypothetical protein